MIRGYAVGLLVLVLALLACGRDPSPALATGVPTGSPIPASTPVPVSIVTPTAPPTTPTPTADPTPTPLPELSPPPATISPSPTPADKMNAVTASNERSPSTKITAPKFSLAKAPSITVLPVFFVPSDQKEPTSLEKDLLLRHLFVAQERYYVMLKERDTFMLASEQAVVYRSPNPLAFFSTAGDPGPRIVPELFKQLGVDKDTCHNVILTIVMNPIEDFPAGGGRPFNGGVGRGGGVVLMSSFLLDHSGDNGNSHFQDTLEHELGHAFGLVHTDAYGYSMPNGASIMSYNLAHQWKGFQPPAEQGIFIPEDLYALSNNPLVFPNLKFDPEEDIPPGYQIKKMQGLVPMDLSGAHLGYELFWDGNRVGHEEIWSGTQAIQNLLWNRAQYPAKKIRGTYYGQEIVITGKGYELYFNGIKKGGDPAWNLEQATANLQGNKKTHASENVDGIYDGVLMH